jgi:hypothetical protein
VEADAIPASGFPAQPERLRDALVLGCAGQLRAPIIRRAVLRSRFDLCRSLQTSELAIGIAALGRAASLTASCRAVRL